MFGTFVGTFLISLPDVLEFLGSRKLIIRQGGDGLEWSSRRVLAQRRLA